MPDSPLIIKFNTPFKQAVEAANQRGVMLPADYYALPAAMRSREFTVSHIAKIDQIQAIFASLQKAQVSGISLQKWQKEIDYKQFGITKMHAETVFRNAMQTHYAIGHWESFQRTKKALPYLRYSAINDSRTSACCRALSGIIRRVDDPFWASHTPPNHHNCRSTLQALTESQAQKRSPAGVGLNQVESPDMNPQKGWDYNPAQSHDKMLGDLLEQKIANLPKASNWFKNTLREQTAKKLEKLQTAPVSNALILPQSGIAKDVAQTVLAEIDKIHSDGKLPQIPVLLTDSKIHAGTYRATQNIDDIRITISQYTTEPEFDFTHEIGHFLDHQAISEAGVFASINSDLMANWRVAVKNSLAIKEILALPEGIDYKEYYLDTTEMWARCYAQYIAMKGDSPPLIEQLNAIRTGVFPEEIHRLSQWSDKDFEPIMREIDQLFLILGWKK